jgi:hypothetical protein
VHRLLSRSHLLEDQGGKRKAVGEQDGGYQSRNSRLCDCSVWGEAGSLNLEVRRLRTNRFGVWHPDGVWNPGSHPGGRLVSLLHAEAAGTREALSLLHAEVAGTREALEAPPVTI